MRSLYADFDIDLASSPTRSTGSPTTRSPNWRSADCGATGTREPEPGEFGPVPDEDGDDDGGAGKGAGKRGGKTNGAGRGEERRDSVTSPRQALEAIKNLNNA